MPYFFLGWRLRIPEGANKWRVTLMGLHSNKVRKEHERERGPNIPYGWAKCSLEKFNSSALKMGSNFVSSILFFKKTFKFIELLNPLFRRSTNPYFSCHAEVRPCYKTPKNIFLFWPTIESCAKETQHQDFSQTVLKTKELICFVLIICIAFVLIN